ncbi:unnamed protein product [Didymodactylos carnosus]|uniref:Uncharacterized protein n=1 Tax=Didymodactylos carnosus TaxID=1234261 RepID=A0A8S2R2U2_9BILA|nr:unnamed protein product [Didymodactylos carnosus]CAF4146295.1 unnamed protein product [Didymodactylos carnosus]
MCMINPNNILLAQLTGTGGLAMGGGTLQFDWLTLTSQLGSPILTPLWAQINILIGFVLACWLFVPIMYYTNVWNFMTFPIADSRFFYLNGSVFQLPGNTQQGAAVPLPKGNRFEISNNNTHPHFYSTVTFVIGNYLFFASLAALITHTIFYYGKDILKHAKTSLQHRQNDIHCLLMSKYSEAPQWLYWIVSTIGFVSGCFICHYGKLMPWEYLYISVPLGILSLLPTGIINAKTNIFIDLTNVTVLVSGLLLPGNIAGNYTFSTYTWLIQNRAMYLLRNLKFAHYMKISPRAIFSIQLIIALLSSAIRYCISQYLMDSIEGICESNKNWLCTNVQTMSHTFSSISKYSYLSLFDKV